jgi:Ca2+-dependent lipid-binding protein
MITHIVLLQPKEHVTEKEIQTALKHVQALRQSIQGIISIQAGPNLNISNNKGYSYGFVMQFIDGEHLKAYGPHPAHQAVSEELMHISKNILDFDIEE